MRSGAPEQVLLRAWQNSNLWPLAFLSRVAIRTDSRPSTDVASDAGSRCAGIARVKAATERRDQGSDTRRAHPSHWIRATSTSSSGGYTRKVTRPSP